MTSAPGAKASRSATGGPEEFQKIHDTVIKTSPNYFNVSQPITLEKDTGPMLDEIRNAHGERLDFTFHPSASVESKSATDASTKSC